MKEKESNMRQAKWLLLVAVGIFVLLPGCKQVSPAAPQDVRAATYTQLIGTWPLMSGGKQPQFQIGDVSMYWQYDYFDPNLDPGENGNGQFVNLMLGVKYETYSPTYPMTDAHLNITTYEPTGRGAPGLYNFNDYLQLPRPDAFTAIFLIPESALIAAPDTGWDCGDSLWFLCHVSAGTVTGMAGQFHAPRGQAWWNALHLKCTNPDTTHHDTIPGYTEETAWGYNILDQAHWFRALGSNYKWGGVIPFTLGDTTEVLLWAGAGNNVPANGTIVGTVTVTDDVAGGTGYVYVAYDLNGGCLASEAHAGADVNLQALSDKSHKFAPGQLGVNATFDPWDDSFTLAIPYDAAWTSSFVVGAHAIVHIPEGGLLEDTKD
jgi:hypothetical protein